MKKRDYYFDNAKFILIFFVVFGHLIQSFIQDHHTVYTIYKTIYTFHMPAFILISGYFAKGFQKEGYLRKISFKLIIPYLIFQLIYSIFYFFLDSKETFVVDPFDPHWSLWFLISLFFWNLFLFAFTKVDRKIALTFAVILSLLVGYVDWMTNYLSLSRTFVFFPLFLLGFYLKKQHFKVLTSAPFRAASFVLFAIVFTGFYVAPDMNYQWLFGSKPYEALGAEIYTAPMMRLGLLLLSTLLVLAFFSLIPKRQLFFTPFGKNTLYVYLLHGFIVQPFRHSEVQDYFYNMETFFLLLLISFVITVLLSSKLFTTFAQPLIELKMSRMKQFLTKFQQYIEKRKLSH
jgi:fucose 4-O-acetylase-like acetyltransferase